MFSSIKTSQHLPSYFRCLAVINPLRSESRSVGSWRGLVVNLRLLLLTAFDRSLIKFEEIIREQREKRNQAGWSFTKYFLLQVTIRSFYIFYFVFSTRINAKSCQSRRNWRSSWKCSAFTKKPWSSMTSLMLCLRNLSSISILEVYFKSFYLNIFSYLSAKISEIANTVDLFRNIEFLISNILQKLPSG